MSDRPTRVLFAGESWNTYAVHTKGANTYTTSGYEEGAKDLLAALQSSGFDITYLRNHEAVENFPYETRELAERFDVVVLSDIPADSLLLPHAVFVKGLKRPNRLRSLAAFVERGGGLLMVGGYMSFSGFEGRARYAMTPLAPVLPVEIAAGDDRIEEPEGVNPVVTKDHAVLNGVPPNWPYFSATTGSKLSRRRKSSCPWAMIHFSSSAGMGQVASLHSPPTAHRTGEVPSFWFGPTMQNSGPN
jgi:uncharacterized membrane protein